jgi:hypothetical protein
MIWMAERPNTPATARPMMMSRQGESVSPTATAATRTPTLPTTSFREQTQAERMLMSSPRRRHSRVKQARLAASATRPTAPINSTVGVSPWAIFTTTWTKTPTPKAAMMRPLRSAARDCQTMPRPMT